MQLAVLTAAPPVLPASRLHAACGCCSWAAAGVAAAAVLLLFCLLCAAFPFRYPTDTTPSPSRRFKDTVSTVTGGFFLFMLATWLLSMLGMGTMSMLSAGGWAGACAGAEVALCDQ